MTRPVFLLSLVFAFFFVCASASGGEKAPAPPKTDEGELDTVTYADGTVLEGSLLGFSKNSITFAPRDTTNGKSISRKDIRELKIGTRTMKSMTESRAFDRIWIKASGVMWEGELIEKETTPEEIVFRSREYGESVTFKRTEITRIERKTTPESILNFKLFYLELNNNETPRELFKIADWAYPYDQLRDRTAGILEKINAMAPEFEKAYALLSYIYNSRREEGKVGVEALEKEIRLYRTAEKMRIPQPVLYLRLGGILNGMKLFSRAVAAYETAEDMNRIARVGGITRRALLGKGRIYLASGEYDKARSVLTKALEENPDDFRIISLLGDVLTAAGEYRDAEEKYRRAIELEASVSDTYVKLARLYVITGKYREAVAEAFKADKIAGKKVDSLSIEGLAMARMGFFDEAEKTLDEAVGLGGSAGCFMARGYLYENRKKHLAAVDEYKKAVEAGENTGAAEYHIASAYVSAGRQADAKQHLKNALKLGFDAALSFELQSVIASAEGKYEDAARFLRYSIAARPNADRFYRLGMTLANMKNDDGAADAYMNALELDPDHVESLYGLAYSLWKKGDIKKAVSLIDRAVKNRPGDGTLKLAEKRIKATTSQEVWTDSFDRDDSQTVEPSTSAVTFDKWLEQEAAGMEIAVKNGECVISGTQREKIGTRTMLMRKVHTTDEKGFRWRRFEATIAGQDAGKAIYGIRMKAKGAIVLCIDASGEPVIIYKPADKDWVGPLPANYGKPFDKTKPHIFAIELSERRGGVFSLYVDNILVGSVKGLGSDKSGDNKPKITMAVYGQAPENEAWRIAVREVKVFWEKEGK